MSLKIAWRALEGDRILHSYEFKNLKEENRPYTYIQLFDDIKHSLKCPNYVLESAKVHKDVDTHKGIKASTDDDIFEAFESFGTNLVSLFLKHSSTCQCEKPVQNALSLMMTNARADAGKDRPSLIENPKDNKQKLYNVFLTYCAENNYVFPSNKGKLPNKLILAATELMFYIDGHYKSMKEHTHTHYPNILSSHFSGYNTPEKHGHRKRQLANLSENSLSSKLAVLREILLASDYLNQFPLANLKLLLNQLVEFCESYCQYLKRQQKRMKLVHETPREKTDLEKQTDVHLCKVTTQATKHAEIAKIEEKLNTLEPFKPVAVREIITPGLERRRVHDIIDMIKTTGLNKKSVLYVHHVGGNKQNLNMLWRLDDTNDMGDLIKRCTSTIQDVKASVPTYERRVTKRAFIEAYGKYACKTVLRSMFANLTGSASAPTNLSAKEIDERFAIALECEDTSIIWDLRHVSKVNSSDQFKVFFEETEKYLSEDLAVHERRHGSILYLAKAVGFRDLRVRVMERLPPETPIPSTKWLRYQFQAINPFAKTAKYFIGRLNIKMMVQKRQVYRMFILFISNVYT